ncbi:GtrA family protein [Actinocorallia sp. A-T 12471]|uniref:GtrA family protein n=1 Tax=Actinocorallia sp. A-T 12471 TaxID=3089813 RepID=UPI0029D1143D|nr:GtrA family protein [Actinocorallia sp. A-T 12471]MDX6745081.1 GtrA family protein [Actinocorallia sp. A-T 12471]
MSVRRYVGAGRRWARRLAREFAKFGSVGAIAFVITTVLFNVFRALEVGPITSITIATVIATTFSYFANRHWTFQDRERSGLRREYVLFFGLNGVGLVITQLFIGANHYVLHLDGKIAENVALVLGTGAATIFRFWSYRRWVFLTAPASPSAPVEADSAQGTGQGAPSAQEPSGTPLGYAAPIRPVR